MCSGVDAAAYSDGRYMTPAEALETFGQSIDCKFFNGTDYTDSTFTYNGVWSTVYGDHSGGSWTYEGTQFLEYTSNIEPTTNPQYITFDISPLYSLFDTSQIHTVICLSTGSDNSVSTSYQSPSWDWIYDGQQYHLENSSEGDISGQYAYIRSDYQNFTFVPCDLTSSRLASGYSYRAVFSGNRGNYPCRLLIGLPYVSADASGSQGTFTTSSSGDINVNVDVDMSETNSKLDEQTGLLQSIKEGISGIFESIKNALVSVFVPDDGFMDDFKTDMQDLLSEHLGGLYQAVSAIDDIFDRFGEARAKGSIHIDAVNIPLAGETLTLGNWDVPLKVDGLNLLYDGIAFIIDFLAIAGFLNMCRKKLEIFLNPDSEVIEN